MTHSLHLASALLADGWQRDVTVDIGDDGHIARVQPGSPATTAARITGHAVPGLANVHSHAHQRAMAGLAERAGPGADSFWTWREAMYAFALRMGPAALAAVMAQLAVECLKSGFTAIGEFHYLHHQPDGRPFDDPAEMSLACLAGAEAAGIAITLLPTLYAHGGFGGQPPTAGQRRFVHDSDGFARLLRRLDGEIARLPLARLGIALHSLRAVTTDEAVHAVAALDALRPDAPVHIHIAEQAAEVADCLAWCGLRPVQHLLDQVALSPRWCLIHATHMTDDETDAVARSGAVAGLCPITEANLGDGTFNARRFQAAGGALAVGSDSHVEVSAAGELRLLEYSQRLRHQARNVLAGGPGRSTGRTLFDAALAGGATALGQGPRAIAPGERADIVVLDGDHPALLGRDGDAVLDSWIFSGGTSCVRDVFVAGRRVVRDGRHVAEDAIRTRYAAAIAGLASGTS